MNLLPMFYYAVVVEHQSITQAAASLHITQQTLSAHMAALEKELGCTLFQQRPHFALTDAGRIFYRYVLQFQHMYEAMQAEFADIAGDGGSTLTIGIGHTRGKIWLPKIIPLYRKHYPHIRIHVIEGQNEQHIDHLLHGDVDVIIANLPDELPECKSLPFYTERIILAVPRSFLTPAAEEQLKQTRDISMLKDFPFLLAYENDFIGRVGRILLQHAGIMPPIHTISDNMETLMELCYRGDGICFCPDIQYRAWANPMHKRAILAVPLAEQYSIRLAWQNTSYVRKAVADFVDAAVQCVHETGENLGK